VVTGLQAIDSPLAAFVHSEYLGEFPGECTAVTKELKLKRGATLRWDGR
jgi:hypothetical protein